MKTILMATLLFISQFAFAQSDLLQTEDFNHSLMSDSAVQMTQKNGETYNQKNWLNPVLHNIYMANNRSEAAQHRLNLQNVTNITAGRIRYIDMLGSEPLNWDKISSETFSSQVQKFHSIAGFDTTNFNSENAPVIVLFSSASHNLLSATFLDAVTDLTKAGYIVAMMEYPGYGGSLGTPSKANWQIASLGFVQFVKKIFPNRSLYLVGHSIGSAVAIDVAARAPQLVQGVISHAGIYNLPEASKDSSKFLMSDILAPIIAKLMASNENWDSAKHLITLAQKNVPIFLLHGKEDFSVSFRQYELLVKDAVQLKAQNPKFPLFAQAFDSSHEDIYASSNYGKYNEIWTSIFSFINIIEKK